MLHWQLLDWSCQVLRENCGVSAPEPGERDLHRQCRRKAPTSNAEAKWPVVEKGDWCYEWIK